MSSRNLFSLLNLLFSLVNVEELPVGSVMFEHAIVPVSSTSTLASQVLTIRTVVLCLWEAFLS